MKKSLVSLLLVLLITVLVSGCAVLRGMGLWQDPEIRVADVRISQLSLQAAQIEVDLVVKNPNHFAIQLGALDYQLQLAGVNLISGEQAQGQRLGEGETQTLRLPVQLVFNDLAALPQAIQQARNLDFVVQGGMRFDPPWMPSVRLPFEAQGSVPKPELPQVRLVSLTREHLSLSGVQLLAEIRLDNPNHFAVILDHFDYGLSLNQHSVVRGRLARAFEVDAEGAQVIRLPIHWSFADSGRVVYDLLRSSGALTYELSFDSNLRSDLPALRSLPLSALETGEIRLIPSR